MQIKGIKIEEATEAIRAIKTGKAGEENGLEPEMIKYLGEQDVTWL